eukprot:TRINITY_DN2124_c2_g1_i3.p1 TRINITY_DN2124_c2_g1~~TRINITY_DN2124_c2_g1_i3.p1  ORF type:complete len:466 (-),score=106.16 TRINITY_DN2124_c2_g1_i3:306-1604(-)
MTLRLGALFLLFTIGKAVLPTENFFEGIFKGEGVNCDGTFAKVDVTSEQVIKTEEEVITAVAEAIATNTETVNDVNSAVAAAQTSAEKILEVVAEAAASVSGFINSPAPTCWAIAFGKAQAVAIANATVTAIGQGIARAVEDDEIVASVETEVQNQANDLQVSIETIALLLVDGSGNGFQFDRKDARAVARAKAVNCILARAFAQLVGNGQDETIVLTQAGCLESPPPTPLPPPVDVTGCECIQQAMGDVPGGCGKWGDFQNGDTICYVKDPDRCPCDWRTDRYDGTGMFWRYCGESLRTLQQYLNIQDDSSSDILGVSSNFAFCAKGTWNPDSDENAMVMVPEPSPSPTPAPWVPSPSPYAFMSMVPPPVFPTVENCPRSKCIGSAAGCCSLPDSESTCQAGSREYKFIGKCAGTNQKVFLPNVGFSCACR